MLILFGSHSTQWGDDVKIHVDECYLSDDRNPLLPIRVEFDFSFLNQSEIPKGCIGLLTPTAIYGYESTVFHFSEIGLVDQHPY